jgi:hypothetical protein
MGCPAGGNTHINGQRDTSLNFFAKLPNDVAPWKVVELKMKMR